MGALARTGLARALLRALRAVASEADRGRLTGSGSLLAGYCTKRMAQDWLSERPALRGCLPCTSSSVGAAQVAPPTCTMICSPAASCPSWNYTSAYPELSVCRVADLPSAAVTVTVRSGWVECTYAVLRCSLPGFGERVNIGRDRTAWDLNPWEAP